MHCFSICFSKFTNHIIKRLRTDAGRFGHFLPLSAISSAVSGQSLTKSGMEIPVGSESVIAKMDFQNSNRLPWKTGNKDSKGTDAGSLACFPQAASDAFPKQPRILFPSSLGHFFQAASDTFLSSLFFSLSNPPHWLCFSTCQGESLTKQWTYGPT